MAQIKLDGTNLVKTGGNERPDPIKRVFTGTLWEDRFDRSNLRNYYENVAPSAAMEVQRRLRSLNEALASFRWPNSDFGLNRQRLIVEDPGLKGNVTSYLPEKENYSRYDKYYSRGFTGGAKTSLDDKTYKFDMKLGGASKSLEVDVTDSMDNDDVLDAVADAVNDSTLPVQARRITQTAPGLNQDDLLGTGSALAFSVNAAYGNDELSFRDTSGHLISSLELKETEVPLGPAKEGYYNLKGEVAGAVSSYLSKSVDPNAETSLSAGTHSIDYTMGPESGTISFDVESGDTWDEVLDSIVNSANTASDKLDAVVEDARMPSEVYTGDDYYMIDAEALRISAKNPKIGERLVLDPGDSLSVLGLNSTAQPGTDSKMVIDGKEEIRAPGTFTADEGRVVVELEESFGETLPLRVVEAMGQIEKSVSGIADSYNDLRKSILPAEELFEEGFANRWREPLEDRREDYKWMGLREAGEDKLLWFDSDAFYKAMGAEPETVRELLDEAESGLVPLWKETNDTILKNKVSSYLIPESSLPNPLLPEPPPKTELELERSSELLDLYEDDKKEGFDFDSWMSGPLVERKG